MLQTIVSTASIGKLDRETEIFANVIIIIVTVIVL